jgi:hypothetical protein
MAKFVRGGGDIKPSSDPDDEQWLGDVLGVASHIAYPWRY